MFYSFVVFLEQMFNFFVDSFFRGSAIVDRMQGVGSQHQAQFHGQAGIGPLRAAD